MWTVQEKRLERDNMVNVTEEDNKKNCCSTCKYDYRSLYENPCKGCVADKDRPRWEPAEEVKMEEQKKWCRDCKYDNTPKYESPCKECIALMRSYGEDRPYWVNAKEEKKMEENKESEVSIVGVKKIFLSLPMRNRIDEEIKNDINKATEILKKLFGEEVTIEHSFITPLEADVLFGGKTFGSAMYLGRALQIMAQCDTICRLPGYDSAYGCMVETTYADRDKMNIIDIPSWESNKVVINLRK